MGNSGCCLTDFLPGKVPALRTHASGPAWPASLDLGNDKTYTDLTVCVRAKIISFPQEGEVELFKLDTGLYDYFWDLGIFQPLSGMRDLGKQVFIIKNTFKKC